MKNKTISKEKQTNWTDTDFNWPRINIFFSYFSFRKSLNQFWRRRYPFDDETFASSRSFYYWVFRNGRKMTKSKWISQKKRKNDEFLTYKISDLRFVFAFVRAASFVDSVLVWPFWQVNRGCHRLRPWIHLRSFSMLAIAVYPDAVVAMSYYQSSLNYPTMGSAHQALVCQMEK